ncbi:hypothetical protein [Bradyrhizobium oligotrophicum]|uniref:hypothetical protein n=1 Tax=Bradyrhizobium oligotrophicum TaxID=44255 RepID=UPI003EBDF0C0
MTSRGGFERWFDKLMKYRMAVPALAFAGIAAGLAVVQSTLLIPGVVGHAIGGIGVALVAGSALIFLVHLLRLLQIHWPAKMQD